VNSTARFVSFRYAGNRPDNFGDDAAIALVPLWALMRYGSCLRDTECLMSQR
jgi:hypothetical protein